MSATQTYQAQPRTETGGTAAAKLRASGKVPVTISRRGQPSRHLAFDLKAANHLDTHVVHLCRVEAEGTTVTTLRGAVEKNVLTDAIVHIDLLEVDEKSTIKVDVAVRPLAQNCPGVKAGGLVEQRLRKIKVRCPANAIPDEVTVDLSEVELMQTINVDKIRLPAGVQLVTAAKLPLLSVVIPRGMRKAEEDEAAAAAAALAASEAGAAAAGGEKKEGETAPAAGKTATPAAGKTAAPAAGKTAAPAAGDKAAAPKKK